MILFIIILMKMLITVCAVHYPMWINSSSKLTAFISSYTSISIANPDDICLNNTIGKIRIMAIEFKE